MHTLYMKYTIVYGSYHFSINNDVLSFIFLTPCTMNTLSIMVFTFVFFFAILY